MTIVDVSTDGDYLCATAEVVSQPERALDELQLEEVVGAAVVRVQHQAVGLLRLKF